MFDLSVSNAHLQCKGDNTEVPNYLPYSSFFKTRALKAGHVILEEGQFVDSLTLYKCQFGGKISLIGLTG